jgi:hypothetical protein
MAEVKRQKITDKYAIYNADCVDVIPNLPSESVGYSVFSPPFCDLYSYSEDPRDMGNSPTPEIFFEHFDFLVGELHRVLMPGRCVSVHCCDLPIRKQDHGFIAQYDFPGDIIRHFESRGFMFHSRHCIWKDPLIFFMRTKQSGLAHKQIVTDSSLCRTGSADYVVTFRKRGENSEPITHPQGLSNYAGLKPVPIELSRYRHNNPRTGEPWNPKVNKLSHWIWQRYASPVWDDVHQMKVLPYKAGRDQDDEKHVCPLQLQVIERCLVLWSNPSDIVLTPFMGVGSEVYESVRLGRRGLGIELKSSYFRQAVRNLKSLQARQASKVGLTQ